MIKKDKVDILLERVDRAIALLEARITQPVQRKPYTKRTPVAVKTRAASKRGATIPHDTYEAIRHLGLNEKVNMTAWMRTNKVSLQQLKDRIYSFMWKERKEGNNNRYVVGRDQWEVFVQRTA